MKKIGFLLISFLMVQTVVHGQETSLGVKAGLNISNLSNAGETEALTGLSGGVFLVHSIIEHFGVSLDVLYSAEGAKYSDRTVENGITYETENKLRLNYIRLPLLANVFFGSLGDNVRPKISLGPTFGFLAGAKSKMKTTVTENGSVTTTEGSSSDKSAFAGFDFGAIVGAGVNVKAGDRMWINLDGRYQLGATDVNEIKQANGEAVKSNVFSVMIGIAIGLSGE